ncbi:pentapeptide repeat-containing protein [Paractinoplanes lichenicola]|uniref:Pentapeptide repeat-containing protein n=1 Tax=Paractinoplanes lichenicola TaxID=2802976 RepID=A0ABS1VMM1_9ACTN|nr:pentapeptide repeat-containing protein [Actinoplanes lichenicola]MBL7254997.1 pentapeptide repeat-containing protein [Actinoplanes lichenicola]
MPERELHADCSRCVALCCVAPAFAKSSDFAIDKPAGTPCRNLGDDFRCTIHERLDSSGFHGCVVFDCFGAGQRLTQETFGGADWRQRPEMFAALPIMRQLHELMWFVTEALKLDEARRVHPKLRDALAETDHLAAGSSAELRGLDLDAIRRRVNPLLQRASELARASFPKRKDHRGANLIGRRMRGADLRGASFRGALLIGADLRDADLRRADFTGADLRGADLRGADLTGVLFFTDSQRRAAVSSSG